jgi:hypothetical protein
MTMNCLVCARSARNPAPAVAICPHCSAGLCLTHVEETARTPSPGGMRLSCGHGTWDPAWQQTSQAERPQESSVAPVR